MQKISHTKNKTSVKIVINLLASLIFFSNTVAVGQQTPPAGTPPGVTPPGPGGVTQPVPTDPTLAAGVIADQTASRRAEACSRLTDRINDEVRKIAEACRKAGMGGGSNCVSRALRCGEASGEDAFDTTAAFTAALGAAGINTSGAAGPNACLQMSGRDYFTEKERIEKEIKDLEKELADLEKDKTEKQRDYDKEIQDLQEELTKAQEEFKAKELEISAEEREQIAQFQESQRQAAENMRKGATEILTLRGQLIASQRDKALQLLARSEEAGRRACNKAVRDARAAYQNVSGSGTGSHVQRATQKKRELLQIYSDCMSSFEQQRIALNESKRQEEAMLNDRINNAQSNMDEIQNSLNSAAANLEELKAAATKKKNDALQAVIDLGKRNQEKMQAANTRLQQDLQTFARQTASLQAALNRANQSLLTLGPVPRSRGTEYSEAEASSEIEASINNIERARRGSTDPECIRTLETSANEALRGLGRDPVRATRSSR